MSGQVKAENGESQENFIEGRQLKQQELKKYVHSFTQPRYYGQPLLYVQEYKSQQGSKILALLEFIL